MQTPPLFLAQRGETGKLGLKLLDWTINSIGVLELSLSVLSYLSHGSQYISKKQKCLFMRLKRWKVGILEINFLISFVFPFKHIMETDLVFRAFEWADPDSEIQL